MLQSFILIDELASSRAAASSPSSPSRPDSAIMYSESIPVATLRDLGFRVHTVTQPKELVLHIDKADAALLSVAPEQVEPWRVRVLGQRSLPVFWWCDAHTFPSHECRMNNGIDGLIGPDMNAREVHCSLLLGVNHYFERTQWQQEREQLLSRLEERKWIDQAKRILSEIKRISEAEAYEFLRKQAMNERKRMVDVATSIVKVYQLLQDENQGGRKR